MACVPAAKVGRLPCPADPNKLDVAHLPFDELEVSGATSRKKRLIAIEVMAERVRSEANPLIAIRLK